MQELLNNLPKEKDLAKSHSKDCAAMQSTSYRGDFGADCDCTEYSEAVGFNKCLEEIKKIIR